MTDVNIPVPAEVHEGLTALAAAEGMSLRTYLTRLADRALTPADRAERAKRADEILKAWNGYDPTPEEAAEHSADLDRRLAKAMGQ